MRISLVVAMDRNRVIGRNNSLPWYLPEDLRFFKRITMGKPVIMGRRTWESIGRPLPGRANIVVTRQPDYEADGIKVVHDMKEALMLAEAIGEIDGRDEAMIIGGSEIFLDSLRYADRIYLTEVHGEVEGDTWFPDFDRSKWKEVSREDFEAEEPNPYAYSFVVLDRAE
jgi:dihydrofolate reductase